MENILGNGRMKVTSNFSFPAMFTKVSRAVYSRDCVVNGYDNGCDRVLILPDLRQKN